MKKLLETMQVLQRELIGEIGGKKTADNLKEVAGVTFKNGTLTADDYVEIYGHIDEFNKEQKRFEKDSTKIVLEKNLAFNIFSQLKSFYTIFWPHTNKAKEHLTQIGLKKAYQHNLLSYKKYNVKKGYIAGYILIAFISGIITLISTNPEITVWTNAVLPLLIGLIVVPFFIKAYVKERRRRKEYRQWVQKQHTEVTLKSFADPSGNTEMFKLKVTLSKKDRTFHEWHGELLHRLTTLAAEMRGKIVWLCSMDTRCYLDPYPWGGTNGLFDNPYFELLMDTNKASMLPVIITDHSVIIYLPEPPSHDPFTTPEEALKIVNSCFKESREHLFLH